MRELVVGGLFAFSLIACGDDSAGDGAGTSGSESSTSSDGGDDPVTEESGQDDAPGTTDDGPDTTTDSGDESTSSMDTGSTDAAETTGPPPAFTLTSPAFADGETLPDSMHISGGNMHPQLDWVGAPDGTLSFGIFFHDDSISFEHSAIWNISADATGVPEGIEHDPMPASVPGAVQCDNWKMGLEYGFGGPGSSSNTYQFTLYALDIADLSGEIDQDSSRPEVRAALEAHAIESTTLTGDISFP